MSESIKAGDLVQVIRMRKITECQCDKVRSLGRIFRVEKISVTDSVCIVCGTPFAADLCAWVEGKNHVYEIDRLKRIPPLEELQTFRQTDETTV